MRKVNFKKKQPSVVLQCVIISLSAVQMVFACLQLLIHTPKLNNKQYLGERKKNRTESCDVLGNTPCEIVSTRARKLPNIVVLSVTLKETEPDS